MRVLKLSSILLVSSVLLTACVTYPVSVQVPQSVNLISYSGVQDNDTKYVGEQARWSGVIAAIKNLPSKTQLDVLYYPANASGRPLVKEEPVGRFKVFTDKFLDPAVYEKGRSITVVGTIVEKVSEKIDEYEYVYPTLERAKVHLWKKRDKRTEVEFYYGWPGHYPRYYWHGGTRHIYTVGSNQATPEVKIKAKGK
jgi:outer membrane lipoprotein